MKTVILDSARIEYWRKKFFPHLTPEFGTLCIITILLAHQKP